MPIMDENWINSRMDSAGPIGHSGYKGEAIKRDANLEKSTIS